MVIHYNCCKVKNLIAYIQIFGKKSTFIHNIAMRCSLLATKLLFACF